MAYKRKTPVIAEQADFVKSITFLLFLVEAMSPVGSVSPAETILNKIQNDNWDLTAFEVKYLTVGIKTLDTLSFDLRLNGVDHFVNELSAKIAKAQEVAVTPVPPEYIEDINGVESTKKKATK